MIDLCARFVRYRGIDSLSLEDLVQRLCVIETLWKLKIHWEGEIDERISRFPFWLHPLFLESLDNESTALRARASSMNKSLKRLCFESNQSNTEGGTICLAPSVLWQVIPILQQEI